MNLLKQSKVDLMDHIESMQNEINRLQKLSESQEILMLITKQKLQRALGYIDCINEGKDSPIKSEYFPSEICHSEIRYGPRIEEINNNY
jgi:hypothetical protein